MEDLLVGGVCRSADLNLFLVSFLSKVGSDVLYMPNDHVGALALVIRVLPAANGADVRGDTSVDDDVFLARVTIDIKAAEYEEAVTKMQLAG